MQLQPEQLEDTSQVYYFPHPGDLSPLLYYPVCVGYFDCKPRYAVQRNSYNSYLLIAMLTGSLSYQTRHMRGVARAGQVLLVDCNAPHAYAAQGKCSFTFVHFDGAQSRELFEELLRRGGCLIKPRAPGDIHESIGEMLRTMRQERRMSQTQCSAMLYGVLMQLLESGSASDSAQVGHSLVDRAIALGAYKVQLFKPHFNQATVDKAHAHGILCNVFYADDPEEARHYRAMGIDTILTNDFLTVKNALTEN